MTRVLCYAESTKFEYEINDPYIIIYDLYNFGKSVTNNIEKVLEIIDNNVPFLRERKIIYRDQLGNFDAIIIDEDKKFKDFILLQEPCLIEAINKYESILKEKPMEENKIPFDYEKYLTEKYEVICRDEEYKVDELHYFKNADPDSKIVCNLLYKKNFVNEISIITKYYLTGINSSPTYYQYNLFLVLKEIPFDLERAQRGDQVKMKNGNILTDIACLPAFIVGEFNDEKRKLVSCSKDKIYFHYLNGNFNEDGSESEFDLVMAE